MTNECFNVNHLDLVFGKNTYRAFSALDIGKNRDQIHKEFNQIVAVRKVDLTVYHGEILVIMGFSGSGKSSLLRCFNGMNGRDHGHVRGSIQFKSPTSNQIFDILHCSKKELLEIRKHKISMVFQQFGLMPWKTVAENVAYPLEIQKRKTNEIKEQVEEKLRLVGLSDWKNKYPHELSGGMQQRVGLARAFVTNADVLLMDEPFSALDPLHRKHLQEEIIQLQYNLKKTVIFVTHDFSEAVRIGSRIAIMDSGRILQIGTAKDLIENPSCEIVKKFTTEVGHHQIYS
ncbi:ATP-binding cassette domain-containing protein [Pigmentibacter ruber]|uniref:ATP-binding cassette domain-containing protein n=1 Tax=Pigmentibacter ruber TaxID=2683196 RepID=UPI00131BB9F9|nr:ATP-binding cassette domain-containing protein [Pigmentibacter ruber]